MGSVYSVKVLIFRFFLLISLTVPPYLVNGADQKIKPYVLAYRGAGDVPGKFSEVRQNLKQGGFEIVGGYVPYQGAYVFAVTDKTLKNAAAKTRYGGFGAVMRVGIAKSGDEVQVMFNNPSYLGVAYRMKSDLTETKQKLIDALGFVEEFGPEFEPRKLARYNYAFGLEGFGDFYYFGVFKNYAKAVENVEKILIDGYRGLKRVYRVDIPGKKQTVFGVKMNADKETEPFLNEQFTMNVMDVKPLKRLPHLPYEIIVDNNVVIGQHAHYRLAISFPDLPMIGKHGFGRMMRLPYRYEDVFSEMMESVGATSFYTDEEW